MRDWDRILKAALQTHAQEKISHVNGGLNGGSCVHRPGSEDPHWREKNFLSNSTGIKKTEKNTRIQYFGRGKLSPLSSSARFSLQMGQKQ